MASSNPNPIKPSFKDILLTPSKNPKLPKNPNGIRNPNPPINGLPKNPNGSNPNPPINGLPKNPNGITENNSATLLSMGNFNPPFNGLPLMGRTENDSATLLSTGNPLLDFFFHIVPDTPPESLVQRLALAWNHDPLRSLKLICNLRGVRGTGKSDKEGFYAAAFWLYKNHPKTLAYNVKSFAEFGYFKDLPEILYRLLEGFQVRKIAKDGRPNYKKTNQQKKLLSKSPRGARRRPHVSGGRGRNGSAKSGRKGKPQNQGLKIQVRSLVSREGRIRAEMKRAQLEKENARNLREEKRKAQAKKAVERYFRDPNFRLLYDSISELFAEFLISDLRFLNSGQPNKISLASKWCPSLDLSFDRSTLLCESIARRIFPRISNPEYEMIEDAHYAYRIRDRLRKEVLVPLRIALELPELYTSSKRWDTLPYNRVASVAMKNYAEMFTKHDEERFKEYLESVKRGEKKIAAGALLPHQIIKSLDDKDGREVAELQWRRMVDDLLETGKLKDCMAICDVSGSMAGTPMEVCVALGLLISELSEEPWKSKLITFSTNPQLQKINGGSLRAKTKSVERMDWDMSTDFQKVFDLILKVAVNGKLKEAQMIKRLFVFSDMEFDRASENDWETDYQAIQRKFREKGYKSTPEIVFWNLRDSKATPVSSEQNGVALVSGFSKNLLRVFLEGGDDVLRPLAVMERTISGKEYNNLVVVD